MKSPLKKRAVFSNKEMQEYIDKAWEQHRKEEFENCKRDIIAQLMSACCMALHTTFGFGEKRLNEFKKAVEETLRFEAFGKSLQRRTASIQCEINSASTSTKERTETNGRT